MEEDASGAPVFHVKVINGPHLKRADVAMILEGLHRARSDLGAAELGIPASAAVPRLTNHSSSKEAYDALIARGSAPKPVRYKNSHIRAAIEAFSSPLMGARHNLMSNNAVATPYAPDPSVKFSLSIHPARTEEGRERPAARPERVAGRLHGRL